MSALEMFPADAAAPHSHFVTQNGLAVTCDAPGCCTPTPHSEPLPATAAAVKEVDEQRWFDELCDAIEDYLRKYVAHHEATKSRREPLAVELHEAKRNVITRFYAAGWDK